jgi:hypothetical protein
MGQATTSSKINAIRASIAARHALTITGAAGQMFGAAGSRLLGAATRASLAGTVLLRSATPLRQVTELLSEGVAAAELSGAATAANAGRVAGGQLTRGAGRQLLKTSAKQVAKGMARAAAVGAVVDGVVGAGEALYKISKGEMAPRNAWRHIAKETGTGAAATAAGVGLVAAVVTLVGPIGAGTTVVLAGGGSVATKLGLNAIVG